ncbi:MAG: DUF4332 domain-containing protein [Candidatus Thorarchaeota archaeon]|jgi:hypothetical protein
MGVDWSRVKELTLWNYDELLSKIQNALDYKFVQKHYDRKLSKVGKYTASLLNYREDKKYEEYSKRNLSTLRQIEIFGVRTISELVTTIRDRDECVNFLQYSSILFEDLIVLLNCILRWILPFARPIRDFVNAGDKSQLEHLSRIRKRKVRFNLDMIQECKTEEGRESMAVLTDTPKEFIIKLLHRADISRIPWIRGKTVLALSSAGYNTLEKIANTSPERMIEKLEKALAESGKKFSRSWMEPEGAITQAKVLPKVVES